MGSKSSKSNKKRHIYDELNKTIDSFNSFDDYSRSDDEIKNIINKTKKKHKIKKHKRIRKELNNELIESSIIISDFLINNIINKNNNRRQLPDTNSVNSLLLINNFFGNDEERLKINEQMNFCEKIINNGINNYKAGYKNYQMSNKYQNLNNDNIPYNYSYNIQMKKNRVPDSREENKNINKTEIDFAIKNKSEFENISNNNINNNNQSFASYLYKPKQIKNFINKNITSKRFQNKNNQSTHINDEENIENNIQNKIIINNNKGYYIKKKQFLNQSPNFLLLKNKDKENVINLSNLDNKKKYTNDINNIRIYCKKNKKYARNNNVYLNEENNISVDNIKKKSINEILKQEDIKKVQENNFRLNNTQDVIKNKRENFNEINRIEKSTNLNILNQNNNLNIKPYNISKNKTEKSSNFNISKNNNISNKNNIEFESEYRKSKLYLNEENNYNLKLLDNLNKSSLKDFVNKQAQRIRQSPDYIKMKKENLEKKYENNNSDLIKKINQNNYIKNNISKTKNNKTGIQNNSNKNRNIKNSKSKNTSKKNILVIDLRNDLSNGKKRKNN